MMYINRNTGMFKKKNRYISKLRQKKMSLCYFFLQKAKKIMYTEATKEITSRKKMIQKNETA